MIPLPDMVMARAALWLGVHISTVIWSNEHVCAIIAESFSVERSRENLPKEWSKIAVSSK